MMVAVVAVVIVVIVVILIIVIIVIIVLMASVIVTMFVIIVNSVILSPISIFLGVLYLLVVRERERNTKKTKKHVLRCKPDVLQRLIISCASALSPPRSSGRRTSRRPDSGLFSS